MSRRLFPAARRAVFWTAVLFAATLFVARYAPFTHFGRAPASTSMFLVSAAQNAETVPKEDANEATLDDLALEQLDLKDTAVPARRSDAQVIEGEQYQFQAEISKLMSTVIRHIYKKKEIALSELVSNAVDALSKWRLLLVQAGKSVQDDQLRIEIKANKDDQTLMIRDYGVGMSKDELVRNLGTLARSGTKEFMESLLKSTPESSNSKDLIGQFGLGFYSSFLLADKVRVRSKNASDGDAYIWESQAIESFVIAKDETADAASMAQGTEITLFLNSESLDFLEQKTLTEHLRHHSEYVPFPIHLWTEKTEEVPAEEEHDSSAARPHAPDHEEEDVEEVEAPTPEAPKPKTVTKQVVGWEHVNHDQPIWRMDPRDVSAANYTSTYHALMKKWDLSSQHRGDPLAHTHYRSEGQLQFSCLLYIPGEAATNAMQTMQTTLRNLKLYIKRVFITDEFEDMFPRWLSFVKAIVDADDLPLNVNRAQLQQTKMLRTIKRKLVSKSIEMMRGLSEDSAKYPTFLKAFGTNLKLGVMEDSDNKDKLTKLLRFYSSASNGTLSVSLDDYVARMKKRQSGIFFLSGATLADVEKSVFLEKPLARGYEVLYMTEPLDEYLMQTLTVYATKSFRNIAKDGITYGDENSDVKKQTKALRKSNAPLTTWMGLVLKEHVEKVQISAQLVQSPAAIKAPKHGLSANMEKIMNAQALAGQDDFLRDYYGKMKKVMEINPDHPLVQKMLATVVEEAGVHEDDDDDAVAKKMASAAVSDKMVETVHTLYDAALISSGYPIADVASFSSRLERIMRRALSVSEEAKAQVVVEKAQDKVAGEADEDAADAVDDEEDEEAFPASAGSRSPLSDKVMPDMEDMPDLPDLPDFSASESVDDLEADHDEL